MRWRLPREKKQPEPEYQTLAKRNGKWYFDVKLKDGGWLSLGGLSGEVSQEDAEKFAENTAKSWRKR